MADEEPTPEVVVANVATQPVVIVSKRTARAWLAVIALTAMSALFGVVGLVTSSRSLQQTVEANRTIIINAENQIGRLTDQLDCRAQITAVNVAANGTMLDLLALAVIDLINGERAAISGLIDQFDAARRNLAAATATTSSTPCDP